jgi:hypothetical protein
MKDMLNSVYKKWHQKLTCKFSDMPVPNITTIYKYVQKVSSNRFHYMKEANRCVSIIEMKCNKTAPNAST